MDYKDFKKITDEELDDCFGSSVEDEDLELLEELDETETNEEIMESVLKAVDEQIISVPFVEDIYVRLSEKYSEESAKNMIASVLVQEAFAALMEERQFDEESYKAKLLELVEEMK